MPVAEIRVSTLTQVNLKVLLIERIQDYNDDKHCKMSQHPLILWIGVFETYTWVLFFALCDAYVFGKGLTHVVRLRFTSHTQGFCFAFFVVNVNVVETHHSCGWVEV